MQPDTVDDIAAAWARRLIIAGSTRTSRSWQEASAERSMAVLGFSHYNLRADRPLLDELCRFYCEVIGLSLGPRPPFNSFGFWLYVGGRDVLHLSQAREGEHRASAVLTTFDHVAFACSDPEDFRSRLTRFSIAYQEDVVPRTGGLQLFLRDPAGNGVELNFTGPSAPT